MKNLSIEISRDDAQAILKTDVHSAMGRIVLAAVLNAAFGTVPADALAKGVIDAFCGVSPGQSGIIAAVKHYRTVVLGSGLAEAKFACEKILADAGLR